MLLRLAACLVAGLALVSCGPSEPDQRAAFIAFLQNDVLSKPGARVPALSEERRKAFGDYAAQYEVITRFHETMNASVGKPMQDVLARAAPGSIEEVVKRKGDIEAVRAGMATMREALDKAAAAADQARAAMKQPDDLAGVYGKAFDKLVVQPVGAVREIFPATDGAMTSVLALADLIEKNKAAIKLNGSLIEVTDAKLRAKVQEAMTAMNDKRAGINAAIARMRKVMSGE